MWVPKSEIYLNLERFGLEKAAAIIEYKIQEAGGKPKVETAIERSARLKRQMDAETTRKMLLNSVQGVEQARKEVLQLFNEIEQLSNEIQSQTDIQFQIVKQENTVPGQAKYWVEIYTGNIYLAVDWQCPYGNSMDKSGLRVIVCRGISRRAGRHIWEEPTKLVKQDFNFDRDYSGAFGWRQANGMSLQSIKQMAEYCMNLLVDQVHKIHMGG